MIVRELVAVLGFKTDKKSQKEAETGVSKLVSVAKLAAVAFAGIKAAGIVKGIADETRALGDRLDKVSQQIGVGTQALQELEFAAGLAGASSSDLQTSLRILARNALEAAQGSKEFQKDFQRLGVSVKDGSGQLKSTDVLLTELADGMQNLTSDTERTALAQSLLGRSGATLLPLLKQGTAAIEAQREEARELGLLDEDLIRASVKLTDNQLRLAKAYNVIKFSIAKGILPAFNEMTEQTIAFLKANKDIIKEKVGAFFKGLGRIIVAINKVIGDIVSGVINWARNLDPVATKFLKLGLIAAGLALLLLLPGASIIALIALVGLIIEDFQTWREGGLSLTGALIAAFDQWMDQFPGLKAGLTAILDVFMTVFDTMKDLVFTFIQFFIDIFTGDSITGALSKMGENVLAALKPILDPLSEIFGFLGGNIASKLKGLTVDVFGEGPAARPAIGPAAAGGGTSINSSPNTSVEVTINGATDPAAVQQGLKQTIQDTMEQERRQTLNQLTTVGATR